MSNIKCGVIVHFMEDPVTVYGSGPYLAESLLDALKHVSHVSEALSSSVWTTNFQEWEESDGTLYYSSGPFGSRTWWQDLFNLFDIDTLLFIAFSWTGGLKVFPAWALLARLSKVAFDRSFPLTSNSKSPSMATPAPTKKVRPP